ncbi:venom protease [Aethina tumida]|uniref:venom protease n=1 Tax=Aethina tumida TaxID=116153 RepID=UPI002147AAF8|nr:venom protease [Aethina tumida]
MKVAVLVLAIICFVSVNSSALKAKQDGFDNQGYVRRKRYLGLKKLYKLNKLYQECVAPGDSKGHCKHLTFCEIDVLKITGNSLDYLCIIEKTHVGVCCPDDIAVSGYTGAQLIMNLPAGGNDYEKDDNITGCGIPIEGKSVTETKTSSIQEWPWMAALYRPKQMSEGIEQQFCGGAVITDSHILTAAHCTNNLKAQDIHVRLGEYDFKKNNETRSMDFPVAEIIQHQEFVEATYANDIAILRLEKPTTFNSYIWPICLPPRRKDFEDVYAVVAGWGQLYYSGPLSHVLLQVAVPVWPHQKCVDAFIQTITDDNLCAAAYEGGKDSCLGDSGGPLMYQLENGRWVAIGIVSWGIGCGIKGNPGVYTKVNNYLPWIIQNTIAK